MNRIFDVVVLDPKLPVSTVSEQLPEGEVGNQCVHLNVEPPLGPEDTENLLSDFLWFIAVMKHAVRINVIEAGIWEGKMSSVSLYDRSQVRYSLARQV